MLGRSDGTLNPSGVRFGSAEIYNIVEQFPEVGVPVEMEGNVVCVQVADSVCVGQRNGGGEERVLLFLQVM